MTIGSEIFKSETSSVTAFDETVAGESDEDGDLIKLIKTSLRHISLISHFIPVSLYITLDILAIFQRRKLAREQRDGQINAANIRKNTLEHLGSV